MDIDDIIPNDYKPSCFECIAYIQCHVPSKALGLLKSVITSIVIDGILKGDLDIVNAEDLAQRAIDQIERRIAKLEVEHGTFHSREKIINYLRLVEFIIQQKEQGDLRLYDALIAADESD